MGRGNGRTGRARTEGFHFGKGDPMKGRVQDMTEEELEERGTALALRLLDSWRARFRSKRVEHILRKTVDHFGLWDLLSAQERRDLGLPS